MFTVSNSPVFEAHQATANGSVGKLKGYAESAKRDLVAHRVPKEQRGASYPPLDTNSTRTEVTDSCNE